MSDDLAGRAGGGSARASGRASSWRPRRCGLPAHDPPCARTRALLSGGCRRDPTLGRAFSWQPWPSFSGASCLSIRTRSLSVPTTGRPGNPPNFAAIAPSAPLRPAAEKPLGRGLTLAQRPVILRGVRVLVSRATSDRGLPGHEGPAQEHWPILLHDRTVPPHVLPCRPGASPHGSQSVSGVTAGSPQGRNPRVLRRQDHHMCRLQFGIRSLRRRPGTVCRAWLHQ